MTDCNGPGAEICGVLIERRRPLSCVELVALAAVVALVAAAALRANIALGAAVSGWRGARVV